MNSILDRISAAISKRVIPPLVDAAAKEIEKHIPDIVKAVVAAVTATSRELAVDAGHQVTEAIPGELDNKILDTVFDLLGWRR